MNLYDVIIVGAGPAGLTAAIYTSRRKLKTLILGKSLGGQVSITSKIENYPGFRSIDGLKLVQRMEKQVKSFGVEMAYEEVEKIEEKDKIFTVKTADNEYKSRAVILAFGKTPRSLNVPGEKEFSGKGVSYCATCDLPLFKNKIVAVVGGGNSALDAALLGSKIAKKVYLIHRREEFRGFETLADEVKKKENVELVLNSIIIEIKGDKFLESIIIQNLKTNETKEVNIDGLFIEIGYEVKSDWLKDLVKLDQYNQIVINQNCETYYPNSDTIRPGIFAAGDVTSTPFKQIVVSAGEGAKAGLQAYNYLHGIKAPFTADWRKK